MPEVYTDVISRMYHNQTKGERQGLKEIRAELEQLSNRLVKARNLLIDDQLDAADYKAIKSECEKKITELECKLLNNNNTDTNIEELLRKAIQVLSQLDQLWEEATAERKRQIIGSIFPEKLVFDGEHFQTTRLNEGARLIYLLNQGLPKKEKGQSEEEFTLSYPVTPSGFKPETY